MNQTLFSEEIAAMLDLNPEQAFSLEEQEQLYAMSFLLYEKGDYATAIGFFTKLVSTNPFRLAMEGKSVWAILLTRGSYA